MRRDCANISIGKLCELFGKTRCAYYIKESLLKEDVLEHAIILELVAEQRKDMPKIGTPKLYHLIKDSLVGHCIKIGRDKLHDLLYYYGQTIKRKRRRAKTTMSRHWMKKYPNLIKDLEINRPEQVWVSDITYITLEEGFSYLSLITDAYSRKIVGYSLSRSLDHQGCLAALEQALSQRRVQASKLIHHSDRGCQY